MNASRLCALVAYYPSVIPDTRSRFPISLRVLVHLAGKTVDVTTISTALGLQGKKRRKTRPINPGIGTGERLDMGYPSYTYDYAQPGFAEHDLEEFDHLAAELAWTRSLHVLRKGFARDVDLEKKLEENQESEFRRLFPCPAATDLNCRQIFCVEFVGDNGQLCPAQNTNGYVYIDIDGCDGHTSSPPILRALFHRPTTVVHAASATITNRRSRPRGRRAVCSL